MKQSTKHFSRTLEFAIIAVILLVGAYLRLYKISEYMTFLGDEGRDVLIVKRMIVDHKLTLLGPTASVGGFFLGPIYYYFMVPFLWIWKLDPTGPAVMVALFGIATIYLLYHFGKNLFDAKTGLIAASLYAVSPVVIAYSRSSWNPNIVPFFSLLLLYMLWNVIVREKHRQIFGIGVVMGIGLQLHYLFLFLAGVVFGVFLLYGRSKKIIRYYILGIVGFIIGYLPFLAFEFRHGFPNTYTITRFILEGKDTGFTLSTFLTNLNDVTFRLFGRLVFRFPQPELWMKFTALSRAVWLFVIRTTIGVGMILLVSLVWIPRFFTEIFQSQTKKSTANELKRTGVLLLVWFLVVIMLFGFYRRAIYDYYFVIFFTSPFLLTALIMRVSLSLGFFGKLFAVILFASSIVFNLQGNPFRYEPNNQLKQARTIAQNAFELAQGKPFNFALIANFNSDHAYRYFFEIWGNPPVTIENEAVDPSRRTVTDQLIIICELADCQPLGHSLWEIAGFGRAQIQFEMPVSFVRIFKLTRYDGTIEATSSAKAY